MGEAFAILHLPFIPPATEYPSNSFVVFTPWETRGLVRGGWLQWNKGKDKEV